MALRGYLSVVKSSTYRLKNKCFITFLANKTIFTPKKDTNICTPYRTPYLYVSFWFNNSECTPSAPPSAPPRQKSAARSVAEYLFFTPPKITYNTLFEHH